MVLEVSECEALPDAFARAEQECVPLVMRGLVQDWPAIQKWKGAQGLQYMKDVAGREEIKVMCSQSDAFHGAIERHHPMTCRFDEFVDTENKLRWKASGVHTYLAQTPINEGSMKAFLNDLSTPTIVQRKGIAHINLWMAASSSRSSPHYDPYNNVLCVVTGSKLVKLYSPSLTPNFYPLPSWGDSANHSAVDFVEPDFETHPNYRHALEQGEAIALHAGDALFIPEGWWHQVDSQDETIGVNFWWRSQFYDLMRGHMGSYYLRECLRSAAAKEVDSLISLVNPLTADELCGDDLSESESDAATQSESMSSPTPPMSDCSSDDISADCSSSGWCSDVDSDSGEDPPTEAEPQQILNEWQSDDSTHGCKNGDMGKIIEKRPLPLSPPVPIDKGGHNQHLTPGLPESKEAPCFVSLVDLDDGERQGLLWLAGLLCSRATFDLRQAPESLPNLMPLFWEMLDPVGAYVVTNHFESLEEGAINGLPSPQEFFAEIYGGNDEQILSHVLHGRGAFGKVATLKALEKEFLISV